MKKWKKKAKKKNMPANPKYPALPSTTTKNYTPRRKKKNGSKKKK